MCMLYLLGDDQADIKILSLLPSGGPPPTSLLGPGLLDRLKEHAHIGPSNVRITHSGNNILYYLAILEAWGYGGLIGFSLPL